MSDSLPQNSVLLTMEDVYRLLDERASVTREHEAISRRLEALNSKLSAISIFSPPHVRQLIDGGVVSSDRDELPELRTGRQRKWAPAVFHLLEGSASGLTTAEIRDGLRGTELEGDAGAYGNALYSALSKLVLKGELRRDGEYYCLPGQSAPIGGRKTTDINPTHAAILNALSIMSHPIKSGDIHRFIINSDDPVASGMRKSSGNFYKALKNLAYEGKIVKENKLYSLPAAHGEHALSRENGGSSAD